MDGKLVDSNQRILGMGEIIQIAAETTKSPYPIQTVLLALTKELTEKGVQHAQIGNTLFIVHKLSSPRSIFFRALNADVGKNYIENSIAFVKWAYDKGYDLAVTEFQDPSLLNIMSYIAKRPPHEGMGYKAQKSKDGSMYRVTIKLGRARQGEK